MIVLCPEAFSRLLCHLHTILGGGPNKPMKPIQLLHAFRNLAISSKTVIFCKKIQSTGKRMLYLFRGPYLLVLLKF